MKSDFKKKLWLNFGIVAVSGILAFVGMYLIGKDVQVRANVIIADRMQIAAQNGNLQETANLKEQLAQAQNYQMAMDTLLPSQDALVDFPSMVAAMGNLYNVKAAVSFTGVPAQTIDGQSGSLTFSLAVTGRGLDIAHFMAYMETQTPKFIVAIDSMNFTGSDPESNLTAQGQVFFE